MAKLLVKDICKEKGISLKILAEKMGITPSALSQNLNNPNPNIQTLERIARALRVNLSELFDKDNRVINGFVEINDSIYSITNKEQWVNLTNKVKGIVHIPIIKGFNEHRKAIQGFVIERLRAKEHGGFMAQMETLAVFSLTYDAKNKVFALNLCKGEGLMNLQFYSVLDYCIEGTGKQMDIECLVKKIINDIEVVYEDESYREEFKLKHLWK